MALIEIEQLADPRVAPYANMRDSELAQRLDPQDAAAHAGLFIAEGELVVRRLVQSPFPVHSLLTTHTRLSTIPDIVQSLDPGVPIYICPQTLMDEIIGFNMHRGLLAIGRRIAQPTLEDIGRTSGPLVILEDLTNHDNLGGIYRNIACLAGPGARVVLSPRCADPLYRKSLRVSMGNALHVPTFRCQSDQEWAQAFVHLHAAGWASWGLTPSEDAVDIAHAGKEDAQSGGRVALVLGSEGPGLTAHTQSLVSRRVTIPMRVSHPSVDSLNVGMACGIALYALTNHPSRV